jgi:plasmid stabilization system protein ParE
MTLYTLSLAAVDDITKIADYIKVDNPLASQQIVDAFFDAFEKLATFPKLGSQRDDITHLDVRFWLVYSYLVIYSITDSNIIILRVLSGYQNISGLLEKND